MSDVANETPLRNNSYDVIPEMEGQVTLDVVMQHLTHIVQTILRKELGEKESWSRAWDVVKYRFALDGAVERTLEELGDAFGLTRERIRQIESKSLAQLRSAIVGGIPLGRKKYSIHPGIPEAIRSLGLLVPSLASGVSETELLQTIQTATSIPTRSLKPKAFLLLELAHFARIDFHDANLDPLWGPWDRAARNRTARLIERIDTSLTEGNARGLDIMEILGILNRKVPRGEKTTIGEVRELVRMCSTVERVGDEERFRAVFRYLRGRGDQALRILDEETRPMEISDIARRINARTLGVAQEVADQNLRNQLITDDRFVPIGRSGIWGLKEWTHIETKGIRELMRDCLVKMNSPATPQELYDYVVKHRPAQMSSINIYLGQGDHFKKIGVNTWGLPQWKESRAATVPNKENIAVFVEGIFNKRKTSALDFEMVREEVVGHFGVSGAQAGKLLGVNPAVTANWNGSRSEGRLVFHKDWRDRLAAGARRSKPTLRDEIAQFTRTLLSQYAQISLAELIGQLREEFKERPKTTLYAYVSRLEFVEIISVPGKIDKICRLRAPE